MTRGFWIVIAGLGFLASIALVQWSGILGFMVVGTLATRLPAAE